MKVRELMSSPARTVVATMSTVEAAQQLIRHGFTALPVTDEDGALIGIVTEADLLGETLVGRHPTGSHAHGLHRAAGQTRTVTSVAMVMTTPVESLTAGAQATDAIRLMLDERIRCLPVVDGHSVVGVITRRDLLRVGLVPDDARLVADVRAALAGRWAETLRWSVAVQAGVVSIEDYRDDAADRESARLLVAGLPGVMSVTVVHQTFDPS